MPPARQPVGKKRTLKVIGASALQTRVSWWILSGILICGILFLYFGRFPRLEDDGKYAATVFWHKNSRRFDIQFWGQNNNPDEIRKGVARAYYQPDMSKTGWAVLEIETNESYPDYVQAFAAGMLEGSLSWIHIYWHWKNTIERTCLNRESFCDYVQEYLENNTKAIRAKAQALDRIDPYWHQVNLFYIQLDGIEYGWNFEVARNLEQFEIPHLDFLWMNVIPDIKDLERKNNASNAYNPNRPSISVAILKQIHSQLNHSYLIAHSSSGMYSSMLRILKKYRFRFHKVHNKTCGTVAGQSIRFTSYPGAIYSQDDFYQIVSPDDQITIAGITIQNYNRASWHTLDSKHQVLLGPRIMAANRLGTDGKSWSSVMGKHSSGTGNKQWLHMHQEKRHIRNFTLWIVEQIPGKIRSSNETELFKNQSYWISCGIPHYEDIRQNAQSGELEEVRYSSVFYHIPILQTLFIGQRNVSNTESLYNLMRSPELSVVGRSDLYEDVNITLSSDQQQYIKEYNEQYMLNISNYNISKIVSQKYPKNNSNVDVRKGVQDVGYNATALHRNYTNTNCSNVDAPKRIQNVNHNTTLHNAMTHHPRNDRQNITDIIGHNKHVHNGYIYVTRDTIDDFLLEYETTFVKVFVLKNLVSVHSSSVLNNMADDIKIQSRMKNGCKLSITSKENSSLNPSKIGKPSLLVTKDFEGLIDLKLTRSDEPFQAAAGPPFTRGNGEKTVPPFQWSKSRIKHLPHNGQVDLWDYMPVYPEWVWD